MAVGAVNPVDVVRACGIGEGGVHLFDVAAAVRHLRVAVFAGGDGGFVVASVAGAATESLVHAHRCAVIAGAGLCAPAFCGSL